MCHSLQDQVTELDRQVKEHVRQSKELKRTLEEKDRTLKQRDLMIKSLDNENQAVQLQVCWNLTPNKHLHTVHILIKVAECATLIIAHPIRYEVGVSLRNIITTMNIQFCLITR